MNQLNQYEYGDFEINQASSLNKNGKTDPTKKSISYLH